MPDAPTRPDEHGELRVLADDCAADARMFLRTVTEIAEGEASESTLPMCLLALSQVLLMGARLGAIEDVVPEERFEPDPGPDVELDHLRAGLAATFEGLDDYADVTDPVTDPTPTSGNLVGDLVEIAAALSHGLSHHERSGVSEALWWWQFSYLSGWGERAAMALRVVQSVVSHVRLDADHEVVADAEFDALHR